MPSNNPKRPRVAWNTADGHPDQAARQAMLRRSQANRSLADPELSLSEIKETLDECNPLSANPNRVQQALDGCEFAIDLVTHPNRQRGHAAVGKLLKLLCDLCASGVINAPKITREWSSETPRPEDRRQHVNGAATRPPATNGRHLKTSHSQDRSHRR